MLIRKNPSLEKSQRASRSFERGPAKMITRVNVGITGRAAEFLEAYKKTWLVSTQFGGRVL